MTSSAEKGKVFRELHAGSGAFIIPNPYDVGSACLLAHLGFKALATTSAGFAFTVGQRDNTIGRDWMLEHAASLVAATSIPVSADLENGFGDSPEEVAETIRLAGATGLAGGSIEDSTGRDYDPVYEISHAVDRIRAAVEATRSLPNPFVLTARAENLIVGRPDLADTIKRLQAYQEAGAEVLYAPGLKTREEIAEVIRSVDRPVNVLMGLKGVSLNLDELSDLGVRRVSVGSALSRAALGEFLRAAREMADHGTFGFTDRAVSFQELGEMFG